MRMLDGFYIQSIFLDLLAIIFPEEFRGEEGMFFVNWLRCQEMLFILTKFILNFT